MKKLLLFAVFLFGFAFLVQTTKAATYPIKELGNCRDQQECKYFCNIPENTPICWSYGKYILGKDVLADTTTSAETQAKAHGITFPIAELGNCSSVAACMSYCDQPANQTACSTFAKEKGLTPPSPTPSIDKAKFAADAKTILGCDYPDGCKAFCSQTENHQKCMDFARTEGLIHTPSVTQTPLTPGIFDAAQNELGCDSASSCKTLCSQQENYEKCSAFAKEHNLLPQRNASQSGTLNPEMRLQNSSYSLGGHLPAQGFSSGSAGIRPLPSTKDYIMQKLGCTTAQECETYCKEHLGVCPGFPNASSSGNLSPQQNLAPQSFQDSSQQMPYQYNKPMPYPSYYPTNYPQQYQQYQVPGTSQNTSGGLPPQSPPMH